MSKQKPTGATRKPKLEKPAPLVLTVGHSTRSLEDFIRLLQAHGVMQVVDVRTIPRSRHNPQFNAESVPKSLHKARIGCTHRTQNANLAAALEDVQG